MQLAVTVLWRDIVADKLDKLDSGSNRRKLPAQDNRFGNPARVALLTVAKEHISNHLFVPRVEDVACRKSGSGFFAIAHVERLVVKEGEPFAHRELLAPPP